MKQEQEQEQEQEQKQEQLAPFSETIKVLHRLCLQHRSGTLYIYTDEGHGAAITLSRGRIIDYFYRTTHGIPALELMRKINLAKSIYKHDSNLRNKPLSDTEYRPVNNVILSKLGMENPPALDGMGGEVKKILVVEDSALSRRVITSMFEGDDYNIEEAEDGLEALERLKQGVPDLVLLDLILPEMDGYQVLDAMKKNDNYKNIPVIMLTSRDALFDKLKGKMSGTDEYLTKPIDKEKLMNIVEKYLG